MVHMRARLRSLFLDRKKRFTLKLGLIAVSGIIGSMFLVRSYLNNPDRQFIEKKLDIKPVSGLMNDFQSHSLLLDIYESNELHVCIMIRVPRAEKTAISQTIIASRAEDIQRMVRQSAIQWLSFLKFNRTWTVRNENIKFYFYTDQNCSNKPKKSLTIVADVGSLREPTPAEKCPLRTIDGVEGRFFTPPDDHVCVATYNSNTRTALIASGGSHGDSAAVSHLMGHVFGVADFYYSQSSATYFYVPPDASIMMGGRGGFHTDDALAINAFWTSITAGTPCLRDSSAGTEQRKNFFSSLHCSTVRVEKPLTNLDGTQSCPKNKKYWITPLGVCVEIGGSQLPECPKTLPDFDPKSGICCPRGASYDPARMACLNHEILMLKYRMTDPGF